MYCIHTSTDGCLLFIAGYLGVITHPVKNLVGDLHIVDYLILSVHNCRVRITKKFGRGVELLLNRFEVCDSLDRANH